MTISTFRRSSSSSPIVRVACSTRGDGDFHLRHGSASGLAQRQQALAPGEWVALDQVHGIRVVRVDDPVAANGAAADGAITKRSDVVLSAWVADCAPVVLIGADRELAVVHAGWRGLAGGVLDRAVGAATEPIESAVLGPVIGPCCYEFGYGDAGAVAAGTHTDRELITSEGPPGTFRLDMPSAVRGGLAAHGIEVESIGGCTGCSGQYFSHRVNNDRERHVVAAWQEDA